MDAPTPPTSTPEQSPDATALLWPHMVSHASICHDIALSQLQAEGANDADIEAILAGPMEWLNQHVDELEEWDAIRREIKPDHEPLTDKQPHLTVKALTLRAAAHTIAAFHFLREFRSAQERGDVANASGALLNAWNHLYVASDELSMGARTFAPVVAPALVGQKGGKAKWDADPRTQEKQFVFDCWCQWQSGKTHYASKTAFANDMLDKCVFLTSEKKITDWCRAWERSTATNGTVPVE